MAAAAIFDQDGILTDTESLQWQGWVEVLKPFGIGMPKQEYIRNYAGKTGSIIEKELIKKHNLRIKRGALTKKKETWLMSWFKVNKISLMPYAMEAIEFFSRKGARLALASGGSKEEVELKLKKTGILDMFDVISTKSDVRRGKPFPDIYVFVAKKLGIRPEDCIVFEDTQYGVEAAKAAGMKCIAVPTEFSAAQDFSKADGVFPNLKEAVRYAEDSMISTLESPARRARR